LGDVLGEWSVGDDPMKQLSFYSVHGETVEGMRTRCNCDWKIPIQLGSVMFHVGYIQPWYTPLMDFCNGRPFTQLGAVILQSQTFLRRCFQSNKGSSAYSFG
jgi:hypothetical protein